MATRYATTVTFSPEQADGSQTETSISNICSFVMSNFLLVSLMYGCELNAKIPLCFFIGNIARGSVIRRMKYVHEVAV
jgi:hypothetical protein